MLSRSPWSNHADVRFFSFRVPNLSVVFLQEKKYHCLQDSEKQKSEEKKQRVSLYLDILPSEPISISLLKSVCDQKISFRQVSNFNLNLFHLKYVDKAAAELWVEVQIEQMSFVLLLLQNLTKVITMSKIRCFICVFTSKTFIYYHHKVKTNLGEDVSGCTLLFALLLRGLCLLCCFL